MKKIWMVIPAIIFAFYSCQTEGEKLDLNTFSQRYSDIQQQYREQMNQPDARKKIPDIIQKKNREFEKLLASSKTVPHSPQRGNCFRYGY